MDGEASRQSATVCAASHSVSRTNRRSDFALCRQSTRRGGIARQKGAELPEGVALPGPAAAVDALQDGRGDAVRRDHQGRQAGAEGLGPERGGRPAGAPTQAAP